MTSAIDAELAVCSAAYEVADLGVSLLRYQQGGGIAYRSRVRDIINGIREHLDRIEASLEGVDQ